MTKDHRWNIFSNLSSSQQYLKFRQKRLVKKSKLVWRKKTHPKHKYSVTFVSKVGTIKGPIEAKYRQALKKRNFGNLMFMSIVFQTSIFTLKLNKLQCSPWNSFLLNRKNALSKRIGFAPCNKPIMAASFFQPIWNDFKTD